MRHYIHLLFLGFLIVLTHDTRGQNISLYGNLNWIQDSIVGIIPHGRQGFNVFDDKLKFSEAYKTNVVRDSLADDSSTFSRILYDLGGNSNQRLSAVLSRPIDQDQNLFIYFDRHAFPGWMLRSFSRGTQIGADYSIDRPHGVRGALQVEGVIVDNEMNGGLESNSYSISESQSQRDFGSITSDISLDDAYWRRSVFRTSLELMKEFASNGGSIFQFGVEGEYLGQKFLYNDLDPDSIFYSAYSGDTITGSFRDSILSNELSTSLFARVSKTIDSNFLLTVLSKVEFENVYYSSNSLSRSFLNVSVNQEFGVRGDRFDFTTSGSYYLTGFNAGDIHVLSKLSLDSRQLNDAGLGLKTEFFGMFAHYEPIMVFQFYENALASTVFDYNKVNSISGGLSLSKGFKSGSVRGAVKYEALSNAVYFKSDFTSQQYSETIQLLTPSIAFDFEGKVLRSNSKITYQINSQDSIYSLPEWVVQSEIAAKFRLFKKKIGIETGLNAWYFSDYYARGYLPMINQMYIQNDSRYGNYFQFDPFVKASIQRVDLSLIYFNSTYGLLSDDPIIAPGYPILPRFLKIVIDWKFKN